jgi:uncharacterized protein YggE
MTTLRTTACLALLLLLAPVILADDVVPPRVISVSGNAEIHVVPDEVKITVGIETLDQVLKTSKARNDDIVTAALAAAEEHGVAKDQMKTDYLSIEPEHLYQHGVRTFKGYQVRRTIVITLREVPRFEDLLTALLEAGVNHVHGVDFRTTELRKHRDKARALAIKAAREKAEALAAELGETVGQPRSIGEGRSGWYSGYGWWGARGYNMMAQNVAMPSGSVDSSMDGPTPPGRITVSASVSVSFELAE